MPEFVNLDRLGAKERHYHIYRIRSSTVSHQDHYHDYFQVCFVTSGELLHRQGDEEVLLLPGDAFVIPPGFSRVRMQTYLIIRNWLNVSPVHNFTSA